MIKECFPKVGIELLKISEYLFLVSLLFVAVINPYSVFLNFNFLNIPVCLPFIVYRGSSDSPAGPAKARPLLYTLYSKGSYLLYLMLLP